MRKRFDVKWIGGDRAAGLLTLLVCPAILSGCIGGADMAEIRRDQAYGYPSLQAGLPLEDRAASDAGSVASAASRQRLVSPTPSPMMRAPADGQRPATVAPVDAIPALREEGASVLAQPVRRSPVYDMERDPTIQAALRVGLKSGDIFALPVDAEGNAILPPIPRSQIIDLSETKRLLGSGDTATRLD